ncbi:MAG: hypothetical protein PHF44_04535, partial [Candidatus Pacebacteria bacterium]|nr:hypothetical protein [Candidatus Paceibacterota bacterium]
FILGILKFFDGNERALSIQSLIDEIKKNKEFLTLETLHEIHPSVVVDKIDRNYSPITVEDEEKIDELRKQYLPIIEKLKTIRNKECAHLDDRRIDGTFVPNEVEKLINTIQEMLNTISARFDMSTTLWDHLKDEAVDGVNFVLDNLHRGEEKRHEEIMEKWRRGI